MFFFGSASFKSLIFWNSQTITSKCRHVYTFNEMLACINSMVDQCLTLLPHCKRVLGSNLGKTILLGNCLFFPGHPSKNVILNLRIFSSWLN